MQNLIKTLGLFFHFIILFLTLYSCEKAGIGVVSTQGIMYDIEGNKYRTDTFGNDIWMIENLKVSTYRNGLKIPDVLDQQEWNALSGGAYCDYDNNAGLVSKYGRLYNWYAVNDTNGLAPKGWHVATKDEWVALINFLGNDSNGKNKLENPGGFAIQLGGRRLNGGFGLIDEIAYYWTSTKYLEEFASTFNYNKNGQNITMHPDYTSFASIESGNSVRCVKDK